MKVEIATAEQEKLEKEVAAGRILSEQEAIMASVVEESKKLQEEAEVNSKVRIFQGYKIVIFVKPCNFQEIDKVECHWSRFALLQLREFLMDSGRVVDALQ